jgi:hypothetical protein
LSQTIRKRIDRVIKIFSQTEKEERRGEVIDRLIEISVAAKMCERLGERIDWLVEGLRERKVSKRGREII